MTDQASNIKDLFTGSFFVLGGKIISRLLGLLAILIMARTLGPTDFGEVALGYTIVSVVGAISVGGIDKGVTRFVSVNKADPTKSAEYITSGILSGLILGIISMIFVYVFRTPLSNILGGKPRPIILGLFSIYCLLFPTYRVAISILQGQGEVRAKVLAEDILGRVLPIFGFIVALYIGHPYFGAILYWILVPLISLGFALGLVNREYSGIFNLITIPSYTSYKTLFVFSAPLAIEGTFAFLMGKADILLIGYFLPSNQVGLYNAVQPLATAILFPILSLGFVYYPTASSLFEDGEKEQLYTVYKTSTKWISIITYPVCVLLLIFPKTVIQIIFGVEYIPASTALVVLTLGMFSRVVVGPNGGTIKAINKPKIELYTTIIGMLVNLIGNSLLIPRLGITGAAIGTSLGYLSYNALSQVMLRKYVEVPLLSYSFFRVATPITIISFLLKYYIIPTECGVICFIPAIAVIIFIYLILIIISGCIDDDDDLIINFIEAWVGVDIRKYSFF